MARRSLLLGVVLVLAAACGSSSERAESTQSTVAKQPGPPVHAHGEFLVRAGGDSGATARLFVVDAAGGRARLLTDDPDAVEVPRWSPDGTHVLSAAIRGEADDLISYPIAGGRPVNLTATKGDWEYAGRWSPDGTRIAYLVQRNGSTNDLYVARADGGKPRLVARLAEGFAWSPDGRRIAFAPGFMRRDRRLLVVPATGGRSQPLGPGGTGEFIDWGPKGQVIYDSYRTPNPAHLWTRTGDTSIGYVEDPRFLPDGTVAFGSGMSVGFVHSSGATRKAKLVDRPTSYSWSPDGRYLAFVSAWNGHVYVARGDGTGIRRLTTPTGLGSQIEVFGWRPSA